MSNVEEVARVDLPIAKKQMTDADVIVIDSAEMFEIGDAMLSEVHSFIKRVEAAFATPIADQKKALRSLTDLEKSILLPAENAKATLRRKLGEFAEKQRIAREQTEREADSARQAEIAAAERELIETERRVIEEGGDMAEVERAEANVAIAHVATAAPVVPMTRGNSSQAADWEVEITDLPTLLEAVAADLRKQAPRFDNTIDVKIAQLKQYAKATNGGAFPGVTFKKKTSIRARA